MHVFTWAVVRAPLIFNWYVHAIHGTVDSFWTLLRGHQLRYSGRNGHTNMVTHEVLEWWMHAICHRDCLRLLASPSGDSSRTAPRRSRVRILVGANFHLRVIKTSSLCSPRGMIFLGMRQSSGIFRDRKKLGCFVLVKNGEMFTTPPPPLAAAFLCHRD